MPQPRKIDGRLIWDIRQVDIAFDDLPTAGLSPARNSGGKSWGDI
jgi:hypothetical protein